MRHIPIDCPNCPNQFYLTKEQAQDANDGLISVRDLECPECNEDNGYYDSSYENHSDADSGL